MTAERIVEGVKESLGIISDDTDINNQIRGKAIAVMHYINNGGGFSKGFEAMAAQIQLRGGENDKI